MALKSFPPFQIKFGNDGVGPPEGVNTDDDHPAIRPTQFRQLINVSWDEDAIFSRSGQLRISNFGVIHDATAYIHPANYEPSTPVRAWFLGDGCPGISIGTGDFIGHFDMEQDPKLQRAAYYSTSILGLSIGSYGGVPYITKDSDYLRLNLIQVPYGEENIGIASEDQSRKIFTLTGGWKVNAKIEFDGYDVLGCDDGAGNGKIVFFDGKRPIDDLTGIEAVTSLALARDSLVVGHASGNKIRIRSMGAAPDPTLYTTVAPGAGTIVTYPGRNSIAEYKDKVYIADGGANVWVYDWSTLAVARNVAGATIQCVATAFGYLFFGYGLAGAKMGQYDNSTWTNLHKSFVADDPNATQVRAMAYFKERLMVGVIRTLLPPRFLLSPGTATGGTYEPQDSPSGILGGDIKYLVVM